jgi:hypothetical protein
MLGGRALHMSALGASHAAQSAMASSPVYFWILVDELSAWAIGRLIDDICQQGALRMAALYAYPELRHAAEYLHEADTTLVKAFARSTTEEWSRLLEKSREYLVEADMALAPRDSSEGGVGHRIQRARYYIAQFVSGLPRLDISAVGDYQRYDTFVQSKLGEAFNFLHVLGDRHDRVRREERALMEQVRNERIAGAQGLADLALLGALLPYYIGVILAHAIYGDIERIKSNFWLWCMFTGWLGFALRNEPRLTKSGRARRLVSSIVWLGITYSLLISSVYFFFKGVADIVLDGRKFLLTKAWIEALQLNYTQSAWPVLALACLTVLLFALFMIPRTWWTLLCDAICEPRARNARTPSRGFHWARRVGVVAVLAGYVVVVAAVRRPSD